MTREIREGDTIFDPLFLRVKFRGRTFESAGMVWTKPNITVYISLQCKAGALFIFHSIARILWNRLESSSWMSKWNVRTKCLKKTSEEFSQILEILKFDSNPFRFHWILNNIEWYVTHQKLIRFQWVQCEMLYDLGFLVQFKSNIPG